MGLEESGDKGDRYRGMPTLQGPFPDGDRIAIKYATQNKDAKVLARVDSNDKSTPKVEGRVTGQVSGSAFEIMTKTGESVWLNLSSSMRVEIP